MTTLVEFARAWHAEIDLRAHSDDIGDLLVLNRAVIEAPVTTREDLVALLGVCISDFRTHHEELDGDLHFADPGEELIWKAINAAYLMLKSV
jgi:hypothetical protein